MNKRSYGLVLCFGVVLAAQFAMAINSFELHKLMNKLDYLKDKLQDVEKTMKSSLQETEHRLQEKLTKQENKINGKIETIGARMHSMEDSLKKKVEASEENARTKLEELKNHIMSKMDYMQESSQTELIKLEENKEILDMLTNSVHNLTTNAEVRSSLKETEHRLQEKLTKHENSINEKIEMHAMQESFNRIVKTSEENTRTNLEEVKNQLISRMENMQLQLTTETKTILEKTQTELKHLGYNKKTLDILTHSVRNMSTLTEKSNKILEARFSYPARSCHVMKQSGKYMINTDENTINVLCEQNNFGDGWTVIQHRFDGSVDFYRNWTEYRNGFGNLDGEFWLGLEYVHQITKNRPHELLVEMKDFDGIYGYAKYGEFEIGDESELYELKKLGTYSGTAGDAMEYHKNRKFTTFDRDNDQSSENCAEHDHGAWWYNQCTDSNLNGRYENTMYVLSAMVWVDDKYSQRGLSYSRMMIRDIIN